MRVTQGRQSTATRKTTARIYDYLIILPLERAAREEGELPNINIILLKIIL